MSLKNDRQHAAFALAVLLVVACVLAGSRLSAQEKADEAKAADAAPAKIYNADYAKIKNPEKSTPENIAAGREIYQQFCANCHGKNGLGDGGDNRGGTDIPNLVDDEWIFGATDGEIFMVIKEGTKSPDMIGYKETIEEKEMWQTIIFMRSIAKKK